MPRPTAKPNSTKRTSLFEKINGIRLTYNQEEISEWVQRIDKEQQDAIGFRWAAEKTQKRQDRVLATYQAFLQAEGRIKGDSTNQEKDQICFPLDYDVMTQQIRRFFVVGIELAAGRAVDAEKPCYQTLTQWRDAIIFHTLRSFHLRDLPAPNAGLLYAKITEVMRCESKRWNITLHADLNTTHVGLSELRQMVDMDMQNLKSWEVTEQHHLAWMIGRVCAVRPGSMALTDHTAARLARRGYLCWGDFSIVRGEKIGEFITDIAFREMKTQNNDMDKAAKRSGVEKPLRARIMSPQQVSNVMFSVTHRILALALRRGIINGINTLDELWNGKGYYITFKQEYLDSPVFLAAEPRGLGVTDKPMSAKGLSDYLQLRGKQMGYTRNITWYSIRRRAATDMVSVIGADRTRLILGHTADSTVLEEHYSDTTNTTDLSAILLGEDPSARTTVMERLNSTLAIEAIGQTSVRALMGRALNQAVDKYMEEDPEARDMHNKKKYNNYRRRVARRVWGSLLKQEELKQRLCLTRADITARIQQCQSSEFMNSIVEQAKDFIDTPQGDIKGLNDRGEFAEADFSDGIDSRPTSDNVTTADDQDTAEPNLEDIVRIQGITDIIVRRTDESPISTIEDSPELYEAAGYVLMQILTQDHTAVEAAVPTLQVFRRSTARNATYICQLCVDDETVPEELKEKIHKSKWHLETHMLSSYHSARDKVLRQAHARQQRDGTAGFKCEFCISSSNPRQTAYSSTSKLLRHIQTSTSQLWGIDHQNAKLAAGVSTDWGQSVIVKESRQNSNRRDVLLSKSRIPMARALRKYGIRYREDPALAIPQATDYPGVVAGGPSLAMPLNSDGFSSIDINVFDSPSMEWESDGSLSGLISIMAPGDQVTIPLYFQSLVEDALISTRL